MPKIKPSDTPKSFNTITPTVDDDPIDTAYRVDASTYDNVCKSPTQLIIKTLVEYFQSIDSGAFYNIFGQEIYGYDRQDLQITDVPALNVYPNFDRARRKTTDMGYFTTYINLDIVLPLMTQRDRYTEVSNNINDIFLSMFIQPRGDLFMAVYEVMPYMKFLGCDFEAKDYKVKNIQDCYVYRIIIDFVIDIQSYLCWLEEYGFNPSDPCEQYPLWENTEFINNLQPYELCLI